VSLNPFRDRRRRPSGPELERRLGATGPLWWQLVDDVSQGLSSLSEQWRFWGAGHGWLLRLQGGRTVLGLEPRDGYFVVSLGGRGFEVHDVADVLRVERRVFARAASRRRGGEAGRAQPPPRARASSRATSRTRNPPSTV
jgi:hypothetical protein